MLDDERGLDVKQQRNNDLNDGEHRPSVLMPLPSRSGKKISLDYYINRRNEPARIKQKLKPEESLTILWIME
jgi:hypothetical protein